MTSGISTSFCFPESPNKTLSPLKIRRRGRFTAKSGRMGHSPVKLPSYSPQKYKLPGMPLSPSSLHNSPTRRVKRLSTIISGLTLSPGTKKAADLIPILKEAGGHQTRFNPRRLEFNENSAPFNVAGTVLYEVAAVETVLGAALDPTKADTRIYPEGSDGLHEKAKFIERIKRAESLGIGFMSPLGFPGMPSLGGFLDTRGVSAPDYSRRRAQEEMQKRAFKNEQEALAAQSANAWPES